MTSGQGAMRQAFRSNHDGLRWIDGISHDYYCNDKARSHPVAELRHQNVGRWPYPGFIRNDYRDNSILQYMRIAVMRQQSYPP